MRTAATIGLGDALADGPRTTAQLAAATGTNAVGLGRLLRYLAAVEVLEVRADNTAAIGLYARYGFQEVHRRRGYYQPGAVDALIMRRKVASDG